MFVEKFSNFLVFCGNFIIVLLCFSICLKVIPRFYEIFPPLRLGKIAKLSTLYTRFCAFFPLFARFFRNCTFFLLKFSTICKLRWCTTPIYPQQGWISRVKFRFGGRILLFFDKTLHKFSFFRQRLCTAKIGGF